MIRPRTKTKNNLIIIFLSGFIGGLVIYRGSIGHAIGNGLGILAFSIILSYPISFIILKLSPNVKRELNIQTVSHIGIFIGILFSTIYLISHFLF